MTLIAGGPDELDAAGCLERLAGGGVGRVGASLQALPTVLPVRFQLHRGAVVFTTPVGGPVDLATRDSVVAFEVDHLMAAGAGWVVVATGLAHDCIDPPLHGPGAAGVGERTVAVDVELVTGWQVGDLR